MTDSPTAVPNCSHYGPPCLAWVDLETTGLGLGCLPIEIAVVITDANLNRLSSITRLIRPLPWATVESAALRMHEESGAEFVDTEIEAFLLDSAPRGTLRMAGNSIHFDRRVMKQHLPLTDAALHYRQIDVTTIKELARLWRPDLPEPKKKKCHRALDDISESIEELRYWRAAGIF